MILFLFIIVAGSMAYEINKCCPDGQMYTSVDNEIICVLVDNSSSEYDWLPESVNKSLVDNLTINFNVSQCSKKTAGWSAEFILNINESSVFLKDEVVFKDNSFCLDQYNYSGSILIIARKCQCLDRICIFKCCDKGKHLNSTNHCIDSGNTTDWYIDASEGDVIGENITIYDFPECGDNREPKYSDKYVLNDDGSISTNLDTVFQPSEFCGDYLQKDDGSKVETIIACYKKITITTVSKIYGIMSYIGAFFFLITAIILCWIPELGGRPKWGLVIQVLCLLFAYLSLGYQQISPSFFGFNFCIFIAFVTQFSFLAAFFWLNVICIDFSRTFRTVRALNFTRCDENKNFRRYSLYAWGGSLSITLITIIVEFTSVVDKYSPIKPNFGETKCWFISSEAVWLYFFGPIGLLLLFNLGLFSYTTFNILKKKRETKALKYDDNRRRKNKRNDKWFSLYLKMFFIMGIPWLTEIISWAHDDEKSLWKYVWYITDLINIARAVFIFVIFCCKKRVWIEATKVAPWLHHGEKFISRIRSKKNSDDVGMVERDTSSVNLGYSENTTRDSSIIISESSRDGSKMKNK